MTTGIKCEHKAGYYLKDGELRCVDCGEPSHSAKWRANVYGIKEAESMEKMDKQPVGNKMQPPPENKAQIWPPAQKRTAVAARPVGRPKGNR